MKLLILMTGMLLLSVFSVSAANTCGILDVPGKTYQLTSNTGSLLAYHPCYLISANNITLDCKGYWLYGSPTAGGILISAMTKTTTIKNCFIDVTRGGYGIQDNGLYTKVINTEIWKYKFVRGDVNQDGVVNSKDSDFIYAYLFKRGVKPKCIDAADSNDDGTVDISDAIRIFNFCPVGCGGAMDFDRTPDSLTCDFYDNSA